MKRRRYFMLEVAGVSTLSEVYNLPVWKDIMEPRRRSTPEEIRATERDLGHRLPAALRQVLTEFGAFLCWSDQLLGTDPSSELSLIPFNRMLRGLDSPPPEGYTAIGAHLDGEQIKTIGIYRATRRSRWILSKWEYGEPGPQSYPAHPFGALHSLFAEDGADPIKLPEGLKPCYESLTEWLMGSLDFDYFARTPRNWRNGAAWDRYYQRKQAETDLIRAFDAQRRKTKSPTIKVDEDDPSLFNEVEKDPFSGYNFFLEEKAKGADLSRPVLFAGNGLCRDPLNYSAKGWHVIAVDLAREPIRLLRKHYLLRKKELSKDKQKSIGPMEAIRADLFKYTPPCPLSGIVARNLFNGYTEQEVEELIARAASWLAPGGFFYLHTSIEENARLYRDPSPWDQYGFLVHGAKSTLAYNEFRINARVEPLRDGGRKLHNEEGLKNYLAITEEEKREEAAHLVAGGFVLFSICGP